MIHITSDSRDEGALARYPVTIGAAARPLVMSDPVVHIVHPPPYGEVPFKHLGLAAVAAGLRRAGLETRYHDLSEALHRRGDDQYHELILRLSRSAGDLSDLPSLGLLAEVLAPDHGDSPLAAGLRRQVDEAMDELEGAEVVAISCNTLTAPFTADLGRRLRSAGAQVVIGGPLGRIDAVTSLLLRLGAADALLAGEGDLTAPALIRALRRGESPSAIPGARWLEGERLRSREPAAPVDLDELPWPELEGNLLDQFVPIGASRGCPRRCAYCSERGLWATDGHRRRTPRLVIEEMEARAAATGLLDFHFHDDLLNGSRRWLEDFVDEVRGRGFTWESFFEPYNLDRTLLEGMRAAGCRLIKYGVQSFSPRLLRHMRRPPQVEAVVEVIAATDAVGISTHVDMLIGHPGETEADHQGNLEAVEALFRRTDRRLYLSLNPYYLAAGSAVWRSPGDFGVELKLADPRDYPEPLRGALAAGPPYPVGVRSSPDRATIARRMAELGSILRRHDKDYLYLGQDRRPEDPRAGRVLPPADQARAAGFGPVDLALCAESDLPLAAAPGRLGPFEGVEPLKATLAAAPRGRLIRIAGGEPTLSPLLPAALAICRALRRPCLVETNGHRCGVGRYAAALARHGLRRALVLLPAATAARYAELTGLDDGLERALRGAARLAEAEVELELGLLVSAPALAEVEALAELAARLGARALRLIDAPLIGRSPPPRPEEAALRHAAAVLDRAGLPATLIRRDR